MGDNDNQVNKTGHLPIMCRCPHLKTDQQLLICNHHFRAGHHGVESAMVSVSTGCRKSVREFCIGGNTLAIKSSAIIGYGMWCSIIVCPGYGASNL
jgi:hypothetical protein